MTDEHREDKKSVHLKMLREACDAYHPAYMEFNLKDRPDFHAFLANGGVDLDEGFLQRIGDVKGLNLLDICCAGDAKQAFSFENLGANVVATDLSPVAIQIARENAEKIGSQVEFLVADAQTLTPIPDGQFDLVIATYICWFEDLFLCGRSWHRVLKPGGRLVVTHGNPVSECLEERDGVITIQRSYFDRSPEYYPFDGTPMAERYGGWQGPEIVEFFHPLADVVNAIAQAGFCIKEMEEFESWGSDEENCDLPEIVSQLPNGLMLIAEKGAGESSG